MCGTSSAVECLTHRSVSSCARWASIPRMEALQQLWSDAGLEGIATQVIEPVRMFANFDEFWTINMLGPVIGPTVRGLSPDKVEDLKTRVRARLRADADGRITCGARANAIKG